MHRNLSRFAAAYKAESRDLATLIATRSVSWRFHRRAESCVALFVLLTILCDFLRSCSVVISSSALLCCIARRMDFFYASRAREPSCTLCFSFARRLDSFFASQSAALCISRGSRIRWRLVGVIISTCRSLLRLPLILSAACREARCPSVSFLLSHPYSMAFPSLSSLLFRRVPLTAILTHLDLLTFQVMRNGT